MSRSETRVIWRVGKGLRDMNGKVLAAQTAFLINAPGANREKKRKAERVGGAKKEEVPDKVASD